jgi:hypothetical protein
MRFEREGGRRCRTCGVDAHLALEKKNIRNQNTRILDHPVLVRCIYRPKSALAVKKYCIECLRYIIENEYPIERVLLLIFPLPLHQNL